MLPMRVEVDFVLRTCPETPADADLGGGGSQAEHHPGDDRNAREEEHPGDFGLLGRYRLSSWRDQRGIGKINHEQEGCGRQFQRGWKNDPESEGGERGHVVERSVPQDQKADSLEDGNQRAVRDYVPHPGMQDEDPRAQNQEEQCRRQHEGVVEPDQRRREVPVVARCEPRRCHEAEYRDYHDPGSEQLDHDGREVRRVRARDLVRSGFSWECRGRHLLSFLLFGCSAIGFDCMA